MNDDKTGLHRDLFQDAGQGAESRYENMSGALIADSRPSTSTRPDFEFDRIVTGDAREILKEVPADSVDLSFWSPPYHVGKSYEKDLSFGEWQCLIRDIIACHTNILKEGGFLVVNIADTAYSFKSATTIY